MPDVGLGRPVHPLSIDEVEPPFVGRRQQLTELVDFLVQPRPQAALVLIEAQPGMGARRLVEEAMARVRRTVIEWPALAAGNEVLYGPFIEWIKIIAPIDPEDATRHVDKRLEALVLEHAGLVREDAQYLQALLGTPQGRDATADLSPESFRINLHRVMTALLQQSGDVAGPVLFIHNLHRLDAGTLEWIQTAMATTLPRPLTLLTTVEAGQTPPEFNVEPVLRLELEPLSEPERAELFDAIVPALDFLPELRRRVIEQDIGSPLFIRELSRLVAQVMAENSGPIEKHQRARIVDVVPLGMEEIVRRRIEQLEERTRWVLAAASLLGPDCSLALLECFEEIRGNLQDQLWLLESLHFVELYEGEDGPRLRFIEHLVRDLAYHQLTQSQQQTLHRRVASVIEDLYAERLDEHYEVLSFHYERAGDAEKAMLYRMRAADRLTRLGHYRPAVDQYEAVLDHIEQLEPTPIQKTRLARLILRQGRLLRHLGEADRSHAELEAAAGLAEDLGNHHLSLQVRLELAVTRLAQGEREDARAELRRIKGEAHGMGLTAAAAVAANALGVAAWESGDFTDALQFFRETAGLAQGGGMRQLEADALNNVGLIYWRWGEYAEAARGFRAAVALRLRMNDAYGAVAALMNLAIIQEQMGEIRPARRHYGQALERARACGYLQGVAAVQVNLSNLERRVGLVSSAERHAVEAIEVARRIGDRACEITARENLALALVEQRRLDEAVEHLTGAMNTAREQGLDEAALRLELETIDLLARVTGPRDSQLMAVERILAEIDRRGYADMQAQALRTKGRMLQRLGRRNGKTDLDCLGEALTLARRHGNLLEERESLVALLELEPDKVPPGEREQWRAQLGKIAEVIGAQESKV